MELARWSLAIGLALVLLLAGCLSGTGVGESQTPTPSPADRTSTATPEDRSPTPTPSNRSSSPACANSVAFYGLGSPGETAWAPDRIAIGYTVPANASVFFVAFEEGTVLGTTHVTTSDPEYGVTADGDGIPLDTRLMGSHVIRVGVYADTDGNGKFDVGDDRPCRRDGEPVETGPRRINFSSFAETTDSPPSPATPPSDAVIEYDDLPADARAEFTTALAQDGLRECEIALLDVEQSLIRYRGDYYTYAVQSGSESDSTDGCATSFLSVETAEQFS